MYLGFGFSYVEGGPWNDDGIKAIHRYLERVERLILRFKDLTGEGKAQSVADKELDYTLNYTIKKVTEDVEAFQFNTAIARVMELTNAMYKYADLEEKNEPFFHGVIEKLLLILAPFAPHFAEELWSAIGNEYSVFQQSYPVVDESALKKDSVNMAFQVNGKVRANFDVPADADKAAIEQIVKSSEKLKAFFEGKPVKKMIIVPGRIVNVVV